MKKLDKQQVVYLITAIKDFLKSSPSQRLGQAIYNVGITVYPEVFKQVRATELDPFYNDLVIPNLVEAICEPEGLQLWYDQPFHF